MREPPACLWCRTPLRVPIRAANTCPGCARVNVNEDLRIFRTKRFVPRAIEFGLKAVAGGFVLFVYAMMAVSGGGYGYAGVGYSIGFPILAGLITWDFLGLITRRRSILRYEVFLPALGVGCAAPLFILGALGIASKAPDGGTYQMLVGIALLIALPFLVWIAWRERARPDGSPDSRSTT